MTARTAYFDCFSGASGDMVIGALLDAGLPLDGLRAALGSLALEAGGVSATRVMRSGISATKFEPPAVPAEAANDGGPRTHRHVHADGRTVAHSHHGGHGGGGHHSLAEIAAHIRRSSLSAEGKDRAVHLFERLGEAEAAIHGITLDEVHLHEVGALDSVVDVVGAVYGMEWLAADAVVVSPLNVGSGTVKIAHGTYPVPAPATLRLLQGAPVYSGEVRGELVTPTGALLMSDYATAYGPLPAMRVERTGYGAGARDVHEHPNVLRLVIGEADAVAGVGGDTDAPAGVERILTLACEIDDMNPQVYGPLMDRLLAAGALDVFYTPVQMKKGRPGTLVTILARPEAREGLTSVLFRESTSIGVRYQEMWRERLEREIRTVTTTFGPIRFKIATRNGAVLNAAPEFDDCLAAADAHGLPVRDVQIQVMRQYLDGRSG